MLEMFPVAVLLLLVVPFALGAEKYPNCKEDDNVGILNEFGPLPNNLEDHNPQKGKADLLRLGGRLSYLYVKHYDTKHESKDFSYLELYYKNKKDGKLLFLDYIRVVPNKWNEIENAIAHSSLTVQNQRKKKVAKEKHEYFTPEKKLNGDEHVHKARKEGHGAKGKKEKAVDGAHGKKPSTLIEKKRNGGAHPDKKSNHGVDLKDAHKSTSVDNQQTQKALVRKLRVQFVMSDCSCVSREYDLTADEHGRATTVDCPSPLLELKGRKVTKLSSQAKDKDSKPKNHKKDP